MAAVSAGYCAYSSFAIDKLMGYGVTSQIFNTTTKASSTFNNHEYVYMENHMIYAEPVIGMLMVLFFFVIVGYTLYRITRHKSLVSQGESE